MPAVHQPLAQGWGGSDGSGSLLPLVLDLPAELGAVNPHVLQISSRAVHRILQGLQLRGGRMQLQLARDCLVVNIIRATVVLLLRNWSREV